MDVPPSTDLDPDDAPAALELLESATTRLIDDLRAAPLERWDQPTAIDWSPRTIAAHLVAGAEASRRITHDALSGDPTSFYPGGPEERVTSLGLFENSSPAAIVSSLRSSTAGLAADWKRLTPTEWSLPVREAHLGSVRLTRFLILRITELEVHRTDLQLGTLDWDERFVAIALPLRIAWLPRHHRTRADADLSIDGTWKLRADERSWVVEASGSDATVRVADDPADAVISSTSFGLLSFLLGRGRDVSFGEDRQLARRFKEAFPGP
jgi:uncharacterized protein (TIGR03083 family)